MDDAHCTVQVGGRAQESEWAVRSEVDGWWYQPRIWVRFSIEGSKKSDRGFRYGYYSAR